MTPRAAPSTVRVTQGSKKGWSSRKAQTGAGRVQVVQQMLHHTLEVRIIQVAFRLGPGRVVTRAVEQQAQHARFTGRGFRCRIRRKDCGQFKQPQASGPLGQVVAQGVEQARRQSRAQGILFCRKGIHDGNAPLARQVQAVQIFVAHKTVVDRLVEAPGPRPSA